MLLVLRGAINGTIDGTINGTINGAIKWCHSWYGTISEYYNSMYVWGPRQVYVHANFPANRKAATPLILKLCLILATCQEDS